MHILINFFNEDFFHINAPNKHFISANLIFKTLPGVKFVDNTCALQRAYCLIRLPNAIMDTSFDQNIESILPLRNDAVKVRFSSDRDGNHSPQYVQRILDKIFKKTYQ